MSFQLSMPIFRIILSVAFLFPMGTQAASTYTLVEAETHAQGMVEQDVTASGGAFVEQTKPYQPMVITSLPKMGASWVIWARIKDVTLQLKGVGADGAQKELNWEWEQPDEWKWVSFGRHTRAELGTQALVIRGQSAGTHPGLDAIVFAEDDAFNPNRELPIPQVPRPPVAITIKWQQSIGEATPWSYGLNAFGAFDPSVTQNAHYKSNMTLMHAGILRLHNWGMMGDSQADANGWIDTVHHTWDIVKIRKALTGAYDYGPTLLINIPGWPAWMDKDKDGFLDLDQFENYAQFCAQLVHVVNKDVGRHVIYWEVTNERDGPYYDDFYENNGILKDSKKPDRLLELAALYNRCAVVMKAIDPTIKVGGPAVARPYTIDFVTRFVAATATHLDFFSYHTYVSGSKDDSDQQIFDRAVAFGGLTKQITGVLKATSPMHPIPVMFDEYNISWTWETRDPRMTDIKGAVFDALAVTSAVTNGAKATMAWNECDGIYGKMDNSYQLRPSATLFHWLNTDLIGVIAATESTDQAAIVGYAVKRNDGRKSLLLINRSASDRSVVLSPWGKLSRMQSQLTCDGESSPKPSNKTVLLPANSLTLIVEKSLSHIKDQFAH